jgi:anthranilate phosphoribosyltransferase
MTLVRRGGSRELFDKRHLRMHIQTAFHHVLERRDLSAAQMEAAMRELMSGVASPVQIGAFLVALRMKGETVTEIAAAARVMRELAEPVDLPRERLTDIVGTGGDGASIFNVSTASVFVAAAAGARVAKHGNRAVSSKSGAADVLEAAGVKLELSPTQVAQCVARCGVGFMFAPRHHGATRHAAPVRKELATRTLFNLLGPLTNPAQAPRQVLGVYDRRWVLPLAQVLAELGSEHVMVVHAADGLDEISIAAPAFVSELCGGRIESYTLDPQDLGVARSPLDSLRAADAQHSLSIIRGAFGGALGPAADMIALNAGAAIYVSGLASSLSDGLAQARALLASGAAARKLDEFVQTTQTV